MLAEAMAWAGRKILGDTPPNGRDYWAARYWDRDSAERHQLLAQDFRLQKETLSGYLRDYAGEAKRSIEFACGTGEFTRLTAELTPVSEMVAVDISEQGLAMTKAKVKHDNLTLIHGDFWADHELEPADLVVCVDAIHHLGDVRQVIRRLRSYVKPGGIFIGNAVTRDNFHEFGRKRYGTAEHFARTAKFAASALAIRVSGGRLNSGDYRTQLRLSGEVGKILRESFTEVLAEQADPYFMAFAARA
jgi:SAM-dependent methyltransferase